MPNSRINFNHTLDMYADNPFVSQKTRQKNTKIRETLNFAGNIAPPQLPSKYTYPNNLATTVATYAPVYNNKEDETQIFNLIQTLAYSNDEGKVFSYIEDPMSVPLIKTQAIPVLQQITGKNNLDIEAAIGDGCTAGRTPHQDEKLIATWFLSVNGPRTHHLPAKDSNTIVQYYKNQGLSVEEANDSLVSDQSTIFAQQMQNMTETPYGCALATTSSAHSGGGAIHQAGDCTGYPDRKYMFVSAASSSY